MFKTIYRKIVTFFLIIAVFVYLVLEELIWERIAEPVYEFIHGLKVLQRLERSVDELNAYVLLGIFLSLFTLVETLGVVAIAFIAKGMIPLGIVLYAAKIPVAAFTFWLFRIGKDKLMLFGWFRHSYLGLVTFLDMIKASPVYIAIKLKLADIKAALKNFWASEQVRRIRAVFGAKP